MIKIEPIIAQVEKDLKSIIIGIDFFDRRNTDNYECFFTLLNGRSGHAFKYQGKLEVKYAKELNLNYN